MTALEKERAAEMQQDSAMILLRQRSRELQEQAKAEQAKLQLAFEEKMAAMEEANRSEKEKRERIAQEKAQLEAEKTALDELAAEKSRLVEELCKKEQEMSTKAELLAKECAQKNEAMAELAILKAQLAQAERDQETAFQEVPLPFPTLNPLTLVPHPPLLLLSALSLNTPHDKPPCHPRLPGGQKTRKGPKKKRRRKLLLLPLKTLQERETG
jgi:hypothetical protein